MRGAVRGVCASGRLLLAPALVAAALAVGTKTTTAPCALAVLVLAGWSARRDLRALRGPLAAALALGTAAGGVWYLRNLVDHGSPFWPLIDAPWGDPVPATVGAVDTSFLDRPRATIDAVGDDLPRALRRRPASDGRWSRRAAGCAPPARCAPRPGATATGLLIWARAPVTGLPPRAPCSAETTFSTTRYLLPVAATGALALALAACAADASRGS